MDQTESPNDLWISLNEHNKRSIDFACALGEANPPPTGTKTYICSLKVYRLSNSALSLEANFSETFLPNSDPFLVRFHAVS